MDRARIGIVLLLIVASPYVNVHADVAPPNSGDGKAEAEAASRKLATCAPSFEETHGPRGTLITHRHVEYDLMIGEPVLTPPEARQPLRNFIDSFYKALRPCLPPTADMKTPERLSFKLHAFIANDKLRSAVAMATDRRVDTKCIEALMLKREAPTLQAAVARIAVDITLAPFCVVSHEIERGGFPAPSGAGAGFGNGPRRHLMPPTSAQAGSEAK